MSEKSNSQPISQSNSESNSQSNSQSNNQPINAKAKYATTPYVSSLLACFRKPLQRAEGSLLYLLQLDLGRRSLDDIDVNEAVMHVYRFNYVVHWWEQRFLKWHDYNLHQKKDEGYRHLAQHTKMNRKIEDRLQPLMQHLVVLKLQQTGDVTDERYEKLGRAYTALVQREWNDDCKDIEEETKMKLFCHRQ